MAKQDLTLPDTSAETKVPQAVGQFSGAFPLTPWGHNILLVEKLHGLESDESEDA